MLLVIVAPGEVIVHYPSSAFMRITPRRICVGRFSEVFEQASQTIAELDDLVFVLDCETEVLLIDPRGYVERPDGSRVLDCTHYRNHTNYPSEIFAWLQSNPAWPPAAATGQP